MGLTKGRRLDEDDGQDGVVVVDGPDGQQRMSWREWYVQTLHRRVKRSMRECEGELEELRWKQLDLEHDIADLHASIRKRNEKHGEGEDEPDETRPSKQAQSSRDDFITMLKEKAERNLIKVENREQEIVLAQFGWVWIVQACVYGLSLHVLTRVRLCAEYKQNGRGQYGPLRGGRYPLGSGQLHAHRDQFSEYNVPLA